MTQALDQDVTMTERCIRVEAHHVDGCDPSLAYLAVYTTDERGQWFLLADWSFEALGGVDARAQAVQAIKRWVTQLAG